MATVPSPNVAQVSGVTPEGASLAQGLAQTELTKNVESFRAGNEQALQAQQIAAQQAQLDKQLKQQRELEEYRGLLEKEAQDKQIAAAKDQLKTELEARDKSERRSLQMRKVEQDVVNRRARASAARALAQQKLQIALTTGSVPSQEEAFREAEQADEEITKIDGALSRLVPYAKEMEDIFKGFDTIRPTMDQWIGGEYKRMQQAQEMATASSLDELLKGLDDEDGDAPPEKRGGVKPGMLNDGKAGPLDFLKAVLEDLGLVGPDPTAVRRSKLSARVATSIMSLAGVQPDPEGKIANNINRVLSAMEKAGDPKAVADGKQALTELRTLGVDTNIVGTALSTMYQGLSQAATSGIITAPDLQGATTGPDGKATSYWAVDPEKMKKRAAKLLSTFRDTYMMGGAALGVPVTSNGSALKDWLDTKISPLTNTVGKIMEDLRVDGVIDDPRLLQELEKFSPEAKNILMSKITPIQAQIQTSLWQSNQEGMDTKDLFGPDWKKGGVNFGASTKKIQDLTQRKTDLQRQVERQKAFSTPKVRAADNAVVKQASDAFLQDSQAGLDELDALGEDYNKGVDRISGSVGL